MRARGPVISVVVGLIGCLVLAGCGDSTDGPESSQGFELPVGPIEWDATAPAWFYDGTLHVGDRAVELGERVDRFVLGATGVYWMRGQTLMFTSAEGRTSKVAPVGWGNLAVSADRSVFATVDQSRGPTDEFGTHVIQVAAFDTRTGEQLYRTPDEEPDDDADLAVLYGETMPLLRGVSDERIFFDETTIHLEDGWTAPATQDADGIDVYEGYAETLFADGYHVSLRGQGRHRELDESTMYAVGRLSPDRSTIFDVGVWPTPAVVYDAETGEQRPIDAPWDHFTLVAFSDEDTFFGVAERIDQRHPDGPLRARRVVSCEVRSLACTPVSPVVPSRTVHAGDSPYFLVEGSDPPL